jgi:predicted  nucleic acid-binding Zn-ribbon protein
MMQNVQMRLVEHRDRVQQQESALATIERDQEQARGEIAAERLALEEQLRHARQKREGVAARVGRSLLAKYDKIRGRKGAGAVFALRDGACGNCDTAIPLQRRNVMARSGSIEMCEGCGVLLYAEN